MIEVVSGVLVHGGRFLLQQRSSDREFPLTWETPGGKVENGEEHLRALAREWQEELGVSLDTSHIEALLIFSVGFEPPAVGQACRISFYRVWPSLRVIGQAKPLDAAGLGWFSMREALALSLTPGTRAYFDEVARTARRGRKRVPIHDRCGTEGKRNETYDAYWCPKCFVWLERGCHSPSCEFCAERPETPPHD